MLARHEAPPRPSGCQHRPAERRTRSLRLSTAAPPRAWASPRRARQPLYGAFGQRQVSTIYTQLNQYHVVMEVRSAILAEPGRAQVHLSEHRPAAATFRSGPSPHGQTRNIPLSVNHRASSLPSPSVQPGARRGPRRRGHANRTMKRKIGMPASDPRHPSAAPHRSIKSSLANEPCWSSSPLRRLHRAGHALREPHPPHHHHHHPALGRRRGLLALLLFRIDLNVIALIGIVLLIGIVKKNAIMMIDFALVGRAQRGQDPATPSSRPAYCASAPS